MTFRQTIGKLHLWLCFITGLLVFIIAVTGGLYAFQEEIQQMTQSYRKVVAENKPFLPPSQLQVIAQKELPGKHLHSIRYLEKSKAAEAVFYHLDEQYYYSVFINPYNGQVLKVRNNETGFFHFVLDGHFYLWLPPKIGQPVVATATLIFVVILISGIVLWWPRKSRFTRQTFSIKWGRTDRRNLDLHRILGFYASWILIFITFTGLVWGFQWFSRSTYWLASGGKQLTEFYMPAGHPVPEQKPEIPATDVLWERMSKEYPSAKVLEIHIPENDSSAIEVAANPDDKTYWKADYRYFDQYMLEEIEVTHIYGKLSNATTADKIARMNYDIHVGAIAGLAGKILVFIVSLITASLPVTGFMIWWSRREKQQKPLFQ